MYALLLPPPHPSHINVLSFFFLSFLLPSPFSSPSSLFPPLAHSIPQQRTAQRWVLQSLALPSLLTVAHSQPPASTEKVSTTQDYWVFESLLRIYGIFTSGQSVWNSYYSPTDSWLVYWLYVYQCYTYLSLCTSLLASWWRLYGSLAEDSAPIVSNLITSDCIVKPYCVKS